MFVLRFAICSSRIGSFGSGRTLPHPSTHSIKRPLILMSFCFRSEFFIVILPLCDERALSLTAWSGQLKRWPECEQLGELEQSFVIPRWHEWSLWLPLSIHARRTIASYLSISPPRRYPAAVNVCIDKSVCYPLPIRRTLLSLSATAKTITTEDVPHCNS